MATTQSMTFEEGCNKYLEYCRQRNLREGTIGHYKQSYTQFYKYVGPKMPIEDIDESTYKDCVLHLKSTLNNAMAIRQFMGIDPFQHFRMLPGIIPGIVPPSFK